jgi:hypothetical protein
MGEEKETELPQEKVTQLVDLIEKADRLEGPVGELIKAFAARLQLGPRWTWRNSLLLYGFITLIIIILSVLTALGKIASDVLMFGIGLLIGLLANYVRGLFPSKG